MTAIPSVLEEAGEGALKEITKSKAGGLMNDELQIYAEKYFSEVARQQATDSKPDMTKGETTDLLSDSTEILSLYSATAANDYLAVTMYSDGDGEVKHKPLNLRASNLVLACGIKKKLIHGDAFLARTFDHSQYPWERRDFLLSDANENANWVLDAAVANGFNSGKQRSQTNMQNDNGEPVPEKQGPVAWSQTDDDVEVTIALPKGVRGRDIAVTIKFNMLQFHLKNGHSMGEEEEKRDQRREIGQTLLQRIQSGLTLFQQIDPDESTWSLTDGQLVITLNKKRSKGWWRSLYR